jgi:hypothetical protein
MECAIIAFFAICIALYGGWREASERKERAQLWAVRKKKARSAVLRLSLLVLLVGVGCCAIEYPHPTLLGIGFFGGGLIVGAVVSFSFLAVIFLIFGFGNAIWGRVLFNESGEKVARENEDALGCLFIFWVLASLLGGIIGVVAGEIEMVQEEHLTNQPIPNPGLGVSIESIYARHRSFFDLSTAPHWTSQYPPSSPNAEYEWFLDVGRNPCEPFDPRAAITITIIGPDSNLKSAEATVRVAGNKNDPVNLSYGIWFIATDVLNTDSAPILDTIKQTTKPGHITIGANRLEWGARGNQMIFRAKPELPTNSD